MHEKSLYDYVTMEPNTVKKVKSIDIIIIKKGRQCKAERKWYTPYQSEDPSPTIPTYRQKEEKGKIVED